MASCRRTYDIDGERTRYLPDTQDWKTLLASCIFIHIIIYNAPSCLFVNLCPYIPSTYEYKESAYIWKESCTGLCKCAAARTAFVGVILCVNATARHSDLCCVERDN